MSRIALFALLTCLAPLHVAAADAPPPDERLIAYREYRAAFDAASYEQALPLAARVLELTTNQYGADAPELVNPLTNLATTLYRMRQYGEALDVYRRALTILDAGGNATDPRLVAPLHGMGATLRALQREDEAVLPLKRAVDIVRNRDGLHAPAQLPIVKALIACYEATGRTEDAGREHQYAFNVAEMSFGRDDPRMIVPSTELATWYERTGRYSAARLLHTRAVQLADREQPNSLKAVEPLRGVARTYRLAFINGETQESTQASSTELPQSLSEAALLQMSNAPSGEGERALRNALQRLASAGPAKSAERGQVLLDLGDWYRIAGSSQRALGSWREAWEQFAVAGDANPLSRPALIVYRPPSVAVSQRQQSADTHEVQEVQLRVSIAPDGDVLQATVANPAEQREGAERAVMTAVRRAMWRPAFAEGKAMAVTDHVFREQVYIRLPSEQEKK